MNILVTGSRGYVGSALVPLLRAAGHEVLEHDIGVYDQDLTGVLTREQAMRRLDEVDAVVMLAALAHDPAHGLPTQLVLEHTWRQPLGFWRAAIGHANIKRIVVLSSMSVFAIGAGAYPAAKRELESSILLCPGWYRRTMILRPGTIWGATESLPPERFRSHLLLNSMIRTAVLNGRIDIRCSRDQVRPVAHLWAVLNAIRGALDPRETTGTIRNIIDSTHTVGEFAAALSDCYGAPIYDYAGPQDTRSYGTSSGEWRPPLPVEYLAGWIRRNANRIPEDGGMSALYEWAERQT
jgi:nucleoside-diphosphate-sugar epimerase